MMSHHVFPTFTLAFIKGHDMYDLTLISKDLSILLDEGLLHVLIAEQVVAVSLRCLRCDTYRQTKGDRLINVAVYQARQFYEALI